MEALMDFVKIVVPAALVLYAMYLLMRSYVNRELRLKELEIRGRSIETMLPLRIQAYERMCLFLERMTPQNLLVRLNTNGMASREFQQLLLNEIRNEYNHNASQQVFMSEAVWELVKNAKEELIVTINDSASEMNEDSTSLDLAKKIFEKSMNKAVDPIAHALSQLKTEIQATF